MDLGDNSNITKTEPNIGTSYNISFRDIFLALIHNKFIIIGITTVCLIISIIFSYFYLEPIYQSTGTYLVKFPDFITTPYGDFYFPSKILTDYGIESDNERVINRTIKALNNKYSQEQLEETVEVDFFSNTSTLMFVIQTNDHKEAYRIADAYIANYIDAITTLLKQSAIRTFIGANKIKTANLNKTFEEATSELQNAEKEFSKIPKTLSSDLINPEYESACSWLYSVKQAVNLNKTMLSAAKQDAEVLNSMNEQMNQAIEKFSDTELLAPGFDFQQSIITEVNTPKATDEQVGPNRLKNIASALIIGLSISVLIILVKTFFKQTKTL